MSAPPDALVRDYLEAAHAVGEHLLETFARAADEIGVNYYLTSGTLLGARRSGSWIPWDDDIDVIMFRDDYQRFRRSIRDRLPDDIRFVCGLDDPECFTIIPRLLHLGSERIHRGRQRSILPIETRHVPIDIFVLDRAPRSPYVRRVWMAIAHLLYLLIVARHTSYCDIILEPHSTWARRLREVVAVTASRPLTSRGWHALRARWAQLPGRLSRREGPYLATNYSTPHGRKIVFPKASYVPASTIAFAGRTYSAPYDVDAVLTILYGPEFLTPPSSAPATPDHLRGGLVAQVGSRAWEVRVP